MKRSKRLKPVVHIAIKKTEEALSKVGQANTTWLNNKQQLNDLYGYKEEYLAKFRRGDELVMSAQKVLELRAFLAQLDQAINVQQQQVSQSHKQLEHCRKEWLQARTKEQSMQSLVTRYQNEETAEAEKQEQRDNDERNTSQWRHRHH
ncbi:MAG: flagellar export protein FliJ [Gammaproteobacteria bacterium]|nr:MAG: flagellar export protein FliJ [Gammaproteobacteria bacterium]